MNTSLILLQLSAVTVTYTGSSHFKSKSHLFFVEWVIPKDLPKAKGL